MRSIAPRVSIAPAVLIALAVSMARSIAAGSLCIRVPPARVASLISIAILLASGAAAAQDAFAGARQRMVHEIERTQREVAAETGSRRIDRRVLAVMAEVPRHVFVPKRLEDQAYENRPLPIGHGQTISQPYIVALMTDLLRVQPDERVFELGTGSGYQAAILARRPPRSRSTASATSGSRSRTAITDGRNTRRSTPSW
jgi:hypothetical protein